MDTDCVGPVILCRASELDLKDAVRQLLDAGVSVDSTDPIERRTALSNSASTLDLDMTRSLLEHGAKVDHQDAHGQSPLGRLLDRERWMNADDYDVSKTLKMVELLLKAGASPDKQDKGGDSPRSLATKSKYADIRRVFVKSH